MNFMELQNFKEALAELGFEDKFVYDYEYPEDSYFTNNEVEAIVKTPEFAKEYARLMGWDAAHEMVEVPVMLAGKVVGYKMTEILKK